MLDDIKVAELPTTFHQLTRLDGTMVDAFTPNQMRQYARAAVESQRAVIAALEARASAPEASKRATVHSRLMEMSAIIRAGVTWTGNEYAFADLSESDVSMLDDLLGDALSLNRAAPPVVARKELTNDEILEIGRAVDAIEPSDNGGYFLPITFARAIEAAIQAQGSDAA